LEGIEGRGWVIVPQRPFFKGRPAEAARIHLLISKRMGSSRTTRKMLKITKRTGEVIENKRSGL